MPQADFILIVFMPHQSTRVTGKWHQGQTRRLSTEDDSELCLEQVQKSYSQCHDRKISQENVKGREF